MVKRLTVFPESPVQFPAPILQLTTVYDPGFNTLTHTYEQTKYQCT